MLPVHCDHKLSTEFGQKPASTWARPSLRLVEIFMNPAAVDKRRLFRA